MRTLILVIASAITAYGQSCDAAKSASPAQPNQASCASAQPKQAPLSEVQQLTVEKIQAQLQLTKIQERDLQTQLQGVIGGILTGGTC